MDIYNFINSKDIAEYLREQNYQFTVPETAFLIYQSIKLTLEEKIQAWEEIIHTMPDCILDGRRSMVQMSSFHQFLRDYIKIKRKEMKRFYQKENAFYTYETYEEYGGEFCWYPSERYFTDYDLCRREFWINHAETGIEKVKFIKNFIISEEENNGGCIEVETDNQLNVLEIYPMKDDILSDEEIGIDVVFECMWFSFPTPFKRGDILINITPGIKEEPFVLDYMCTWSDKDFRENGDTRENRWAKSSDELLEYHKREGDISDMGYAGYYAGEEEIRHDVNHYYLNLERYPLSLQEKYQALYAISNTITPDKGKGINLELLWKACTLIWQEEKCKEQRKILESSWSEDYLIAAGLKEG